MKAARTARTAFKGPSVTVSKHLRFPLLLLSGSVSSHLSLCFPLHSCKVVIRTALDRFMNVSNIFGSVSPLTDAVSFTNIFECQKTDHHL